MTDDKAFSENDEQLERLLKPLDEDAAPVNPQFIAQAVRSAGEVFAAASAEDNHDEQRQRGTGTHPSAADPALTNRAGNNRAHHEPTARVDSKTTSRSTRKAEPMFAFAKPIAVFVASVVMLVVAIVLPIQPAAGDVTLGAVLDQALTARSLQLKAVRDGKQAQVLVVDGQRVRWDEAPQQYRIASGTRLWRIDEAANTVRAESNPWVQADKPKVDLLALLGVGASSTSEFRAIKSSGRVEHAGFECDAFEFETKIDGRSLLIRAYANAKTHELYSIGCWPNRIAVATQPPIAELQLVARNVPYDESKFEFGGSLSEDGRIGNVVDRQGIVLLRPMTSSRWTPVAGPLLVKPGDWIRTDVRGANAVAVELISGFKAVLGPGSLLELTLPGELKLHRGEVQIIGSKSADGALKLRGLNEQAATVGAGERKHYRIGRDEALSVVAKKPIWLAGFEGSSNNESIGSLIANVDGRDVPLTVGFHRVKVEIRDQIARTTIEESFVNRTASRLEGVFHFPLPQDASISGFGMWIGGQLIEADVVEKQRAREIYETILRERRDPGLLEWTGGNIFKARVFPIEPHSEKRIKIVYTQVLPLRANTYRYSYGLRSELLQKTPLRELSLEVLVNSAIPLKSIDCPTHEVRTQSTAHSAKLEFTAQEYTPTRDFEVVCEIDSTQSDVVVIPHQRGDDGYFLAQVTPPSAQGNWQRQVLPDGEPLNVLLVCDTSGSMDSRNRELQEQFVASVLSSLSPADRFNIATCDVECQWKFAQTLPPTEEVTKQTRDWLTQRRSLGWTDLDRMAKSVIEMISQPKPGPIGQTGGTAAIPGGVAQKPVGPGLTTHVIYIGDGIVTAGDADAQAFVARLKRMTQSLHRGTFHAVSVGSSFESAVLKSIAAIGGGSVRQIDGEQTPGRTASELLNEMAQPGLRNLQVEFKGLQVAAVYPESLPNLSAGTQQIIIGRYLPQGEDQTGEIIVTCERNGEKVKYASRITLKDAQSGNSFIPRLWARAHLEHLLQQGSSEFIKDDIIALSEEFHIMTPYTSLLVLETDADRERFGVKRRFLMRDGERFFADGRNSANFELLQQQMKAAGEWRLGLRRRVLSELAQLGRDVQTLQQLPQLLNQAAQPMSEALGGYGFSGGMGGAMGGGGVSYGGGSFGRRRSQMDLQISGLSFGGDLELGSIDELRSSLGDRGEFDVKSPFEQKAKQENLAERDADQLLAFDEQQEMSSFDGAASFGDGSIVFNSRLTQSNERSLRKSQGYLTDKIGFLSARLSAQQPAYASGVFSVSGREPYSWRGQYINPQQYVGWVNQLLPPVPPEPAEPKVPESTWPAEAVAISNNLVQPIQLNSGGLRFQFDTDEFDTRWNRQTGRSRQTKYHSQKQWLTFAESVGSQTIVNWCDGATRGIHSRAFHLGQTRKAGPRDLSGFRASARPYAESPLHSTFPKHKVEIQRPADGRIVLVLTPEDPQARQQFTITIDSIRNVIVETEWQQDDKVTSKSTFGDYVQLAGCWWPRQTETRDSDNKLTSTTKLALQELNDQTFAAQFSQQLLKDDVDLQLSLPAPSVKAAKVAVAAGKARFEHHLILLLNESLVQNWDEVLKHLERLQQLADGRPGMNWIRLSVLLAARKNEGARQLGIRLVNDIVQNAPTDELFLANHLLTQVTQTVDHNEMLSLLDQLKPLFDRQAQHVHADRQWRQKRADTLTNLQRSPEALALLRELAATAPWELWAQTRYAQAHKAAGDFDKATAWLQGRLDDQRYNEYERQQFRQTYVEMLRAENRVDELVEFLGEWVEEGPTAQTAYDQYLSAIFVANRKDDADNLAKKWIAEGKQVGKLAPAPLAKLNAAVGYALADRYRYYMYHVDPAWLKPLEETALYFFQHEHHFEVATRIVNHHRFNDSDERERLDAEAAKRLQASAAQLETDIVSSYVSWALRSSTLKQADWLKIAMVLRTRWDAEADLPKRDSLAGSLISIYARHSRDNLHLAFLRDRIVREEQADPVDARRVASFVTALFNEMLTRDWKNEIETEAIALLPRLSADDSKAQQLAVQIAALHRFVDRMFEARFQASMKAFQANDKPEELTRTRYHAKVTEFRKTAREALAQRLSDAITAGTRLNGTALANWINVERMHLDVVLNRRLPNVISNAWTILGNAPAAEVADDGKPDVEQAMIDRISEALKHRVLMLVSNLAARRSAPDGLADRVLKYIDAGIANGGDSADAWKSRRLAMLVALDRPDQIERDLRSWIPDDKYPAPWQLTLGRIVAEQGKLDEAIRLFESVKRDEKSLPPSDYAALSKWYLVQGRKDDYRNARVEIFMATEEWQLNNWISQQRQPWYRGNVPLPTELNENVLFAFQALFRKSNSPGQYTNQLRDFYTACRDFRLLQVVPDSIVGRTPQQIYHFLNSLRSSLLVELRNEATADEIMKRLVEVRKTAESPIDKRACDLLEAMIERQSSNVLNQPGPHIDAAVAALQRAFEHDWADGEVQQMAEFLDAMGRIKHLKLNAERLRQLRALHQMTEAGSDARLMVAWSLAHALFISHNERDEGLATIEIAVREFLQANPGGWPVRLNAQFDGYIDLLKRMNQYARAESVVQKQLADPLNQTQEMWLRRTLNGVYVRAFDRSGQVSLGKGTELYQNLWKHLLAEAKIPDDNYQYQVFESLNTFFRIAAKQIRTGKADLRTYAFEQFPRLLRPTASNYINEVNGVKSTLADVLGAKVVLEFLIARMENYPLRLEYGYQSAWQQFGYELAKYRHESRGRIKELEPRLLAIVLRELRRDLTSRQSRNRNIFHHGSTHHWSEKAGDFLRVAEEVLQENQESGRSVMHVANFMYHDLNEFNRAIEVMLIAHGKELLSPSFQLRLCEWLHSRNRHGESIAILEPLVQDSPDTMRYRTMLITAYGKSNRKDQLQTLLAETDEHFRKPGLWTETHMAQLAGVCFENNLYQKCVGYYDEAIDLHQRTQPNRGIGNGTLSGYYTEQGRAWAGLGNTIKAVDAAAAGVIAWGPARSQRSTSLYRLQNVISQSSDLDAYVKYLDKKAAESGTDSPLIRKMVGKVYAEKKKRPQAIAQLKIAIELQPNDADAREALIKAYEDSDQPAEAINQMLALLDFDRHNLDLYQRLAEKLKSDESESERAATTIVEAAPSEAEHHQALAEFRESRNRWSDAILQWQQVARLRALEPTGLINLAEAQIHEEQWGAAQSTLDKLNKTEWPSRFNDVTIQVRNLQKKIPGK